METASTKKLMLFSGQGNETLSQEISECLNVPLGDVRLTTFASGESAGWLGVVALSGPANQCTAPRPVIDASAAPGGPTTAMVSATTGVPCSVPPSPAGIAYGQRGESSMP